MVDTFSTLGSSVQSELQVCALCSTPARYKCPRCAIPTCSLSCSRKHKQDTKCTGERDKAQYVPMNAYGWGTMMRDYCYLEDVGRKVKEWGNQIVRGGYTENVGTNKAASARKSAGGRKPTTGKSKRDIFRAHLEALGIDVDLLPAGMERRNLNQSTFDRKSKSPLLTIELVFYPPSTLGSISFSPPLPYKMLSHKNGLSTALLAVLERQVASTLSRAQRQKDNVPDWLSSIVTPHPEAPECFVPPHCYVCASSEFLHAPNIVYYHKLEPTLSLGELLQGVSFVEFPTIHVFDPDASSFSGTVIDRSGSMLRNSEDDQISRAVTWRKLNKTAGLETISNLVGGYGSEGGSHSEEEITDKPITGLVTLEAYSESDDETTPAGVYMEEDQSLNSDDDIVAECNHLSPAKLLDLINQAQGAADEDILDWGDEWDVDAEEPDSER